MKYEEWAVVEAVRDYRSAGFGVCAIRTGEKRPLSAGWTTRSLEPGDFNQDDNVGLLCGPISDGNRPKHCLVAVDLDSKEALDLADEFLPPTAMIDGRPGKQRSHRYYLVLTDSIPASAVSTARQAVAAAAKAGHHPGPATRRFRNGSGVQVELIGTGGQVAAPPSIHPTGERRDWEGGTRGEPAVLPFEELLQSVTRLALATGCEVRPSVPDRAQETRN